METTKKLTAWSCEKAAEWVGTHEGPGRCAAWCGDRTKCPATMPADVEAMQLETLTQFLPGYGSPSEYVLRLVYGNAELEKYRFASEYAVGSKAVELEQEWRARIVDGTIDALADKKPRAFLICTHCGGLCRGSVSYIGDHKLCADCAKTEVPRIQSGMSR